MAHAAQAAQLESKFSCRKSTNSVVNVIATTRGEYREESIWKKEVEKKKERERDEETKRVREREYEFGKMLKVYILAQQQAQKGRER